MNSYFKRNVTVTLPIIILRKLSRYIPDEIYIKIKYRILLGKSINLSEPRTFNEKLNWLKLYGRNPRYTQMADKYEAKRLVSDLVGKEYVVENYGVYNRWEDIDISKLPNQFVIKCTHDSSGISICKDKSIFDFKSAQKKINRCLNRNWYWNSREWPYKDIKPRIIVDKYLDDHSGKELRDYKFWCFNGKPTYMYITNKGKVIEENFYDMEFNVVKVDHGFPRHQPEFGKPKNFDLMKELASKLSKDIPFVRVDFFDVDDHVYFGEFTFFDWGGLQPFGGDWDPKLGELISLSMINNKLNK